METRGLVDVAIGILMARYQLDRVRALSVLTRYSQTSNRKMLVIAEEIVRDSEAGAR